MLLHLQNVLLSVEEILSWADAHHRRTGHWPKANKSIEDLPPGTNWRQIDKGLRFGLRDLKGGSSLAQLLAAHRGVRNLRLLSPLTEQQIAVWATLHHQTAGAWPTQHSGAVAAAVGENWKAIDGALRQGNRGLPGQDSLSRLLARLLGVRHYKELPSLTEDGILEWADLHHAKTGQWPRCADGSVADAKGETWKKIDQALRKGFRGLPGGSSLPRLLAERRGARNRTRPPRLTLAEIHRWAAAHQERTGQRPTANSGPVVDAAGETWMGINLALWNGLRSLPGGSSLRKLLGRQVSRLA